jgi:hypothetical protein
MKSPLPRAPLPPLPPRPSVRSTCVRLAVRAVGRRLKRRTGACGHSRGAGSAAAGARALLRRCSRRGPRSPCALAGHAACSRCERRRAPRPPAPPPARGPGRPAANMTQRSGLLARAPGLASSRAGAVRQRRKRPAGGRAHTSPRAHTEGAGKTHPPFPRALCCSMSATSWLCRSVQSPGSTTSISTRYLLPGGFVSVQARGAAVAGDEVGRYPFGRQPPQRASQIAAAGKAPAECSPQNSPKK